MVRGLLNTITPVVLKEVVVSEEELAGPSLPHPSYGEASRQTQDA